MSFKEKIPTGLYRTGLAGMFAGVTLLVSGAATSFNNSKPKLPEINYEASDMRYDIFSLTKPIISREEVPDLTDKINDILLEKSELENSERYILAMQEFEKMDEDYTSTLSKSANLALGGIVTIVAGFALIGSTCKGHGDYLVARNRRRYREKKKLENRV